MSKIILAKKELFQTKWFNSIKINFVNKLTIVIYLHIFN